MSPERPWAFQPTGWIAEQAEQAKHNFEKSGFSMKELQADMQDAVNKMSTLAAKAQFAKDLPGLVGEFRISRDAPAVHHNEETVTPVRPSVSATPISLQLTQVRRTSYGVPTLAHTPANTSQFVQPQVRGSTAPASIHANFRRLSRDEQIQRRDDRREKKDRSRMKQTQTASANGHPSSGQDLTGRPSPAARPSQAAGIAAMALSTGSTVIPEPSLFVGEDKYPVQPGLPGWLISINPNSLEMRQLDRKRPASLTALEALKSCITRCEAEKSPTQLRVLWEALRDHVHKAEIKLSVTKHILKKSRILNPENGLPRIFKEEASFPSDLKADAFQLYTRWYQGIFTQDILRGILTVKDKERNADKLDPIYRAEHPTDPKVYGNNGLVLGQWWPTQLCAMRDGAHGAAQAGICGSKEKGAFSVVMSDSGGYYDDDNGDVVVYSGTEGKNFKLTDNTSYMMLSCDLGNQIRVLRSHMLNKGNKYRPEVGLRYDGLYTAQGYKCTDEEKAAYRFRLVRCEGQGPIRCEENAARRPTVFEVEEYLRLKRG